MNIAEKINSLDNDSRKKFLEKVRTEGEKYGIYPLTPNQYSLWCKYKVSELKSDFTNPCVAVTLEGIDRDRLLDVVERLFRANDTMRYRFFEDGDMVYQYSDDDGKLPLIVTDLKGTSDVETAVRKYGHDFYSTPYRLKSEYPVRFQIFELETEKYILMIGMHHLVADAVSVGVVLNDLYSLIGDRSLQKKGNYGLYALSRNAGKGMEKQKRNEKYWTDTIENVDKIIGIPTDYERGKSGNAGIVELEIPESDTAVLKQTAKMLDSNMYTVLSSVYSVIVHNLTEKNDMIIATTFFNRENVAFMNTMGDFASIVPFVFSFRPELPLGEYIRENTGLFFKALDHCDVTFSRIAEVCNDSIDSNFNPVYQTALVYHKSSLTGMDVKESGGIRISAEDLACEGNIENFGQDIYIKVADNNDSLKIQAIYSKELFSRRTIENLMEIYGGMLRNIGKLSGTETGKLILADCKEPVAVTGDKLPEKYKISDISMPDVNNYTMNGERFCILNRYSEPLPKGFYGEVFVESGGHLYETGKSGIVRADGSFEICEERSRLIENCGKLFDINVISQQTGSLFGLTDFRYRYCGNGVLILNYRSDGKVISEEDVAEKTGVIPSLVYRITGSSSESRVIAHQKNIISARLQIAGHGAETRAVQRKDSDVFDIVFHCEKALPKNVIEKISDSVRDEKIFFRYSGKKLSETDFCNDDGLFTYRNRERSENEKKLLDIWKDILNTSDFDIYDSFNNAGGDSLKTYSLLNRMNTDFDVNINISDIYNYCNIHDMAEYIDRLENKFEKRADSADVMFF